MNDEKGIIFNIQKYSIHDGPGIRTTVFFKGCPLRCFWCQNPESQNLKPEILLRQDICSGCGRCVDVCPNKASFLTSGVSSVNRSLCTACGKCVEVCPVQARSIAGRDATVDEVVQEVLKDRKFYANSGGGVTLSGGEPTMQPDFALAILQKCKAAGLHTAIETCGHASWSTMEEILNYTDLVLYDIKCVDPAKHREATGKDNDLIMANIRKIARLKPIRIRVPLVHGFNASVDEVSKIVSFAGGELKLADIDLLSYNKLGEGKYERLGRKPVSLPDIDEELKGRLDALLEVRT